MFSSEFNPEFHWQTAKKQVTRKKVLFICLALILILSIFFIFKKYYFVSGRSIDLDQLVPDNTKAVLTISTADVIANGKDYLLLDEVFISGLGLKEYLKDDEKVDSFIKSIGKDIYWLEKSSESQLLLFKITDVELLRESFNSIVDNSEKIKFNGKTIYESHVESTENPILPISKNKIYIAYLNDYIFCVSNDLDFVEDVIDKHKEALKIDYFGAIKDELASYFYEQTALMLKVTDYAEIENSLSWIKNLSFITAGENKDSFVIKFKIGQKKAELLFNDSGDISQKNDISGIDRNLSDDFLIYYSNSRLGSVGDILNLNENIDNYLENNIKSLYNIDFKNELLNTDFPYYFLIYPDNHFLTISEDSERMKSIYKDILANLKPQTRVMILPDGTNATEYYIDPSIIELKEQEIHGITWYYADLPGNIDFYLVQYNDWYILTNFREKIIELSENQEEFCKLLRCNDESSLNEILMLNLDHFNQKEYLPWLNLFSESYNRLNFINLTEDGQKKLFFELIH